MVLVQVCMASGNRNIRFYYRSLNKSLCFGCFLFANFSLMHNPIWLGWVILISVHLLPLQFTTFPFRYDVFVYNSCFVCEPECCKAAVRSLIWTFQAAAALLWGSLLPGCMLTGLNTTGPSVWWCSAVRLTLCSVTSIRSTWWGCWWSCRWC